MPAPCQLGWSAGNGNALSANQCQLEAFHSTGRRCQRGIGSRDTQKFVPSMANIAFNSHLAFPKNKALFQPSPCFCPKSSLIYFMNSRIFGTLGSCPTQSCLVWLLDTGFCEKVSILLVGTLIFLDVFRQ